MNKELINQYIQLHNSQLGYGANYNEGKWHQDFLDLLKEKKCKTVLDFGCGKGVFVDELNKLSYDAVGYDPAVDKFKNFPTGFYDAILCTDVLEHLEEETFHEELNQIKNKNPKLIYFNVAYEKAHTLLPNGLNCHTLIKNKEWWAENLISFYDTYEPIREKDYPWGSKSIVVAFIKK